MTRLTALGLAALLLTSLPAAASLAEDSLSARARSLNGRIINLDSHVDQPEGYDRPGLDPSHRNDSLQVDLARMREGGVDGVFWAAYVGQGPLTPERYQAAHREALAQVAAVRRMVAANPQTIGLATSPGELERLAAEGRLAAMIGLENGYALGEDLARLKEFHRLGVRYVTLSHVGHNQICDSANRIYEHYALRDSLDAGGAEIVRLIGWLETVYSMEPPPPRHGGLSAFGRELVREMNRLGMMVDVSHIGPESLRQVLEVSSAPVIASHSSCRALADLPRNLDDELLRAIAARGGCIQICALGGFLSFPDEQRRALEELLREAGCADHDPHRLLRLRETDPAGYQAVTRRFAEGFRRVEREFPLPSVRELVDHLEHVARVAGIDHVGIGTDFQGGGGIRGFMGADQAPNITAELLRRGYGEQQIAKIWGGNLLRVWREVEEAAARSGH